MRSNPSRPSTEIYVGIYMIHLIEVNDLDNLPAGDFAVIRNWANPRLVFTNSRRLFTGRSREVRIPTQSGH